MHANPTQSQERNLAIDILRGTALLGILLMNLPQFFNPSWVYGVYGVPSEYTGMDYWGQQFIKLFVEGKFFTIFSFLFGLGFYIFMSRAEAKPHSAGRLYLRRIAALAVIGAIHFLFGWTGDILHLYAVTGLLLLLFYKRTNKTILVWAVCLIAVWFGLFGLSFITTPEQAQDSMLQGQALLPVVEGMYEHLTYTQWIDYQLSMVAPAVSPFEPIFMLAILSMFLIGVYCGRRNWFANLSENKRMIRKTWFAGMAVNVPLLLILTAILTKQIDFGFRHEAVTTLFVQLSGITMSLFYITSFLLLMTNPKWIARLRPIGYVGQMALTNYLGQTVVCVLIAILTRLYDIGTMQTILLCLAIYIGQIGFSTLWMRSFRFGPMEWIWRSFTYWSFQPMRLQSSRKAGNAAEASR